MISTKNKKGFTLIELIVVITILAILGTIAFISLSGYTGQSRDSKRIADITNIRKQIDIKVAGGAKEASFVTEVSGNLVPNISIQGVDKTADYTAGDVNYTALGIKDSEFKDPSTNTSYKIGTYSGLGGLYEMSAKLEGGDDESDSAYVTGNYMPRSSTTLFTGGTISDKNYTLDSDDVVGLARVGDTVTASGVSGDLVIKKISADQKTITFDKAVTGGSAFVLKAVEEKGLIGSKADANIPVTNGSTTDLPY